MHRLNLVLAWLALLGLLLVACAPQAAPPTPAATPAATPKAVAPAITPEDAEWAKVVAAAKKEGTVNTYGVIVAGAVAPKVARAFQERYGISLNPTVAVGAVATERLKSEQAAKKYTADTLDSAQSLVFGAKDSGVTQAVGDLPVFAEKEAFLFPPRLDIEGHIVVVGGPGLSTSLVNTDLVKPSDEPRSWLDLLDPKWRGRMGMDAPASGPQPTYLYTMRSALGLDEEYFRKLARQDLKLYASSREPPRGLASGEIHLMVSGSVIIAGPLVKEGAPIKAVAMKEGAIDSGGTAIALVRNAPHPNAARVYINWLLSPEGQRVYAEARGIMPFRKDVPDFTPASLRFSPTKIARMTLPELMEASRLQRGGTVARLMGLER